MRKKISNIGKKISYNLGFSLREFSKYKSYSSINKGHIEKYHNSLLLRTMRKSGSHFLHSLIGNYINLQYNRNKYTKRLDHPTLRKVFWSSNKYLIDNTLYTETGFKHFIFEHDFECNYRVAFNAKKLINLYRNPLDIFTSMYYYDFKNREKCKKNKKRLEKYKNVTHPRDMMDILLPEFIYSYKLTKNSKKNNAINICYEEMIQDPKKILKEIVIFLELELNNELIDKAVAYSTKDKVIEDEDRYGKKNLSSANINTSFIRSGKIGEWRDYFSESDFIKLSKILSKNNININDFIFDEQNI